MCLKERGKDGRFVYRQCECGSNDFAVRGIVEMFPEFDHLAGKQLLCRNCGRASVAADSTICAYPPIAEKVIAL